MPRISERHARWAILVAVMFPLVFRPLMMMMAAAAHVWHGWYARPTWFWRPFTAASLLVATIATLCWPWFYYLAMGQSFFAADDQLGLGAVIYYTMCYIVWYLALLPHTFARIGWLIQQRAASRLNDKG